MLRGRLWWPTVENTAANRGDVSSTPSPEGLHVPRGTPCTPTAEPAHPRAPALQQEKPRDDRPTHHDEKVAQLPQPEKVCTQQRPSSAKNKIN